MSMPDFRAPTATARSARSAFTMIELLIVISVIAALAAMGFPMYKVIQRKVYIGATDTLVQAVAAAMTTYGQTTWTWLQHDPNNGGALTMRTAYLWDMNQWNMSGLYANMSTTGKILTGDIPNSPTPKMPVQPTKFRVIDGRPDQNAWALVATSNAIADFSAPPNYSNDTQLFDGPFDADLIKSGYSGFYDMCQPAIAKKFVNRRHQIIDAWGQPLRIAYAAKTYGAAAFGVWSAGPNMADAQDSDASGSPLDILPNGSKVPSDDITSWKNNATN